MPSEYDDLGGWRSFKSGEWFHKFLMHAIRNYWHNANAGYFREKYPNLSRDQLARRMVSLACKNAAGLGAATGLTISTDEVVALVTAGGGGIGLPANIAVAAASIGGEMVGLAHIQLKLVIGLAKLYDAPIDLDDPEDIWTIIAFAMGGSIAESAGNLGMRIGKHAAKKSIKAVFSKERLKAVQRIGRMIGIKILQKNLVKYSVPIVSIAIGGGWNYVSTRSIGALAQRHFKNITVSDPDADPNSDGPIIDHEPLGAVSA